MSLKIEKKKVQKAELKLINVSEEKAQKAGLKLINVSNDVRKLFEITVFSDFLTIEWGEYYEYVDWTIRNTRKRKP